MIANHIRIAWRSLLKSKMFSTINIVGLAAGLSCCMLICLYIRDELSYDKQHPNVEQLYQVNTVFVNSDGERKTAASSPHLAAALQQEYAEIANTTRLTGLFVDDKTLLRHHVAGGADRVFYETGGYLVDSTFFDFFHYDFVEGNAQSALRSGMSIILPTDIAQKMFGSESALGKTIEVESNTNGKGNYTVTGVFRPGNAPTHIDGRFFMSFAGGGLEEYTQSQTSMAGNNFMYTYLKLLPGTDARALEAKMPAFVEKYMRKDLQAAGYDKKQCLTAVSDIHLWTDIKDNVTPNGSPTYLYILASIAFFTLLIACINFMNLSTARASKRTTEIGIRKALGAQKGLLVRQFLYESLLFSTLAFLLALALTVVFIPAFEQVSGKHLAFSPTESLSVIGVFFVVSLLTGLVAGSYPALYLSSFKPISVLKARLPNVWATVSIRKGLVVFQFTLSVVLIVAALIIGQQMGYLRSADLGFEKDQQVVIPLRSTQAKNGVVAMKNALMAHAQIESVGASAYYPGIFNPEDANFFGETQTKNEAKNTRVNRVDFDYLRTLGIEPVAGRLFSKEFAADTSNRIILNQTAARELGFATPEAAIGKHIFAANRTDNFTVIGVTKDFHFEDLHLPIKPFAFALNMDGNYNYLVVHLKAGALATGLHAVESTWKNLVPGEPMEYSFLDDEFQKNYKAEGRLSYVVGYFTFIAILISCLGLFGLATFTAEQRTKEIGIRKVLGASIASITGLLAKDFLRLVLVAIIIASPIAYYLMNQWLSDFAYRIDIQAWMFVAAGAAAVLIAFLTVGFQSVKAALANPVKSLRSE
jgi:putative ABC transport system permease protein